MKRTPPRKRPSLLGLLALLVMLGCSGASGGARSSGTTTGSVAVEELPVVAWFENYRTVFSGTYVRSHYLFPRALDLTGATDRLRCSGLAPLVQVPADAEPPRSCDGMAGVAALRCSDDRELQIRWITDPGCQSGYGQGVDAEGNRLLLFFGGSKPLARAALEEAIQSQQRKPGLPAVGESGLAGLGTGTAFFVSWSGHLVTNNHVIDGAKRVVVALDEGETTEARVLVTDRENDLALLQVNAIRTPLKVRRTNSLERGTEVVALGYPLIPLQGREQKATFGHINALSGPQGDERFTQLDAAVQPGNSGGPVLSRDGEVVGVVTLILDAAATLQTTGTLPQNVNYAVKSDLVHTLMRRALGNEWSQQDKSIAPSEWPELLTRVENSVVLVVAER